MAEYVQQATPETLTAIMGFDSGLIDSTLFRDLMDARILIERECTRLACAKLTPASLQMLQAHTEAIYAADDAQAAEVVYLYHKCLTEISGNLAYAMVFQSFEKMIRNLIREGKTPQIAGTMAVSAQEGSVTMDASVLRLYQRGRISAQIAAQAARDKDFVKKHLPQSMGL